MPPNAKVSDGRQQDQATPPEQGGGCSLHRAGSAFVCGNCGHWEPRTNPATVYLGWCPVFSKETVSQHGDKCTAHTGLCSPNEKGQR